MAGLKKKKEKLHKLIEKLKALIKKKFELGTMTQPEYEVLDEILDDLNDEIDDANGKQLREIRRDVIGLLPDIFH